MAGNFASERSRAASPDRRVRAAGLEDNAVQDLGDAGGVADLLLVADHVAEQGHLLHLLEAALPDGPVRRLRRHQEHRGVIPVGRLDRGDEARDAGAVLGDGHGHLARGPRVAVGHQAAVGLVRHVPEGDAGLREEVGDRHEGRSDDAEGVLDAVHLQHLHEGFLGGHPHGRFLIPTAWPPSMLTVVERAEPSAKERRGALSLPALAFGRTVRAREAGHQILSPGSPLP